MFQLTKGLFLFAAFFATGYVQSARAERNDDPSSVLFDQYLGYVADVEAGKFPLSLYQHFSLDMIGEFKRQHDLTVIHPEHFKMLLDSTYLPTGSIIRHYATYKNDDAGCLTVIGRNAAGNFMYVNFEYARQSGDAWRIERTRDKVFAGGSEPVLPTTATCPG